MSNLTWLGWRVPFTYDQFDLLKVTLLQGLAVIALGIWSWRILIYGGQLRRTAFDWLLLVLLVWIAATTVFPFTRLPPFSGSTVGTKDWHPSCPMLWCSS